MAEHDRDCKWPHGYPCRRFSTDGTRLGAQIAHAMGTTDKSEIMRRYQQEQVFTLERAHGPHWMDPEQHEWEGHDAGCESEFITEAGMYSPCQCAERAEEEQK